MTPAFMRRVLEVLAFLGRATPQHGEDNTHQQRIATSLDTISKQLVTSDQAQKEYEGKIFCIDTQRLRIEGVVAWTTGISMLLTILALVFVWRSTNAAADAATAAHDAVNQARLAMEIENRAFIVYKDLTARKLTNPKTGKTSTFNVIVHWRNSGATPARNVFTSSSLQPVVGNAPSLPTGFTPSKQSQRFALGPDGEINTSLSVPISVIDDVRAHKVRLFLSGITVYSDIFKDTHRRLTEFCVEILNFNGPPDITDPKAQFNWDIGGCPAHSCYDEDCPDYKERTSDQ